MQTKHIKVRNQIINNIFALCKIENKPLAEVEKELGFGSGYLKSLLKTNRTLSLDLLLNACKIFGQNEESLIHGDFTQDLEDLQKQQHIADLEKQKADIENELKQLKGDKE